MSNTDSRRSLLVTAMIVIMAAATAPAFAQQQTGTQTTTSGAEPNVQWTVVEARQKCVQEVMAQHPGDPETDDRLRQARETAYRVCVSKAGVRP